MDFARHISSRTNRPPSVATVARLPLPRCPERGIMWPSHGRRVVGAGQLSVAAGGVPSRPACGQRRTTAVAARRLCKRRGATPDGPRRRAAPVSRAASMKVCLAAAGRQYHSVSCWRAVRVHRGPVCYHDQVGRGSPMVVEMLARQTGAGRRGWDGRLLLAVMC